MRTMNPQRTSFNRTLLPMSAFARAREDKNAKHLLQALDVAGVLHPVFLNLGITQLIAQYGANCFPRFCKPPPFLHYLEDLELEWALGRRPNSLRSLTRDPKTGICEYWNCEEIAWGKIRVGQIGLLGRENHREAAFVVVWKHPRADVPLFGAIFPQFLRTPQRTIAYGVDRGSDEWNHWVQSHDGRDQCSCKSRCLTLPHKHVRKDCPGLRAARRNDLAAYGRSVVPPADGLYQVHYFGLWTPDHTTRLACELRTAPSHVFWGFHHLRYRLEDSRGETLGRCVMLTKHMFPDDVAEHYYASRESTIQFLLSGHIQRFGLTHPHCSIPCDITQLPFRVNPDTLRDLADYNEDDEPPVH
jgi:hypothetical protein